jgi:dTDP-4-dehydrorhamnose reductase
MAERDRLTVVEDQIGTPTWARGLAQTCWDLALEPKAHGIYHWSDAGACSWYDFAVSIRALGLELGLLTAKVDIEPISATDYPTPAKRPAFSVLDKQRARALLGYPGQPWREQLRLMLADFKATED